MHGRIVNKIAAALASVRTDCKTPGEFRVLRQTVEALADVASGANPRFSHARFYALIGLEERLILSTQRTYRPWRK